MSDPHQAGKDLERALKFNFLYGSTPETLAEKLGISDEATLARVAEFNKRYPKLRERFCKREQ